MKLLITNSHRELLLEGSDTKSWYLWGFSTPEFCFLECHDTRSGDVASDVLLNSACEVLLTDVYSGYGKALRVVKPNLVSRFAVPDLMSVSS